MRETPIRLILLVAVLIGAAVAAAAGPPDQPVASPDQARPTATKIFAVRHVDVRPLAAVLEMYGGAARPQPELRVVTWTGPADRLTAVEATVAALDVAPAPARNLLLTAWLVALPEGGGGHGDLPASVRAAIERVGDAGSSPGAHVLRRAVLRVRVDSRDAEINGHLAGPVWSDGSYALRVRHLEVVPGGAAPTVRLDGVGLHLEAALPVGTGAAERGGISTGSMSTDVDLELGRASVVGATTLSASGDTLLLVLRVAPAE